MGSTPQYSPSALSLYRRQIIPLLTRNWGRGGAFREFSESFQREFREGGVRLARCLSVVSALSLTSLCPQDDTLTLGGIAVLYYRHKNTKGDLLVAFSISTLTGI